MITFVNENIMLLLCLLIIITMCIILAVKGKFNELRTLAYTLIRQAEKLLTGSQRGREKFNSVLSELYIYYVPGWLKIFVTKDMLEGFLQNWYDDVKDYLDDGKVNKSIPPTPPKI